MRRFANEICLAEPRINESLISGDLSSSGATTLCSPSSMIGPLAYIGGKNRLAKQIISILPEHVTYVEPFAGGAQVFFHKAPSKVEVLNDLDFEIVNFFRCCQHHYEELVRYLNYCLISRRWYD